jgi:hypothetical protein
VNAGVEHSDVPDYTQVLQGTLLAHLQKDLKNSGHSYWLFNCLAILINIQVHLFDSLIGSTKAEADPRAAREGI